MPALCAGALLASCSSDTVEPGADLPDRLTFIQAPTQVLAGSPIDPAVTVAVVRADGGVDFNSSATVTLSLTSAANDTLRGATSLQAVRGIATFSGVVASKVVAGARLYARSENLSGAESAPFAVVTGPPSQLVFLSEPTGAVAGQPLPDIVVQVRDAGGNRVTSATGAVSIALSTGPVGSSITGTTTGNLSNGEVRFSGLRLPRAGAGYTLTASLVNGTVRAPITSAFTTVPGAPAELVFQSEPTTVQAGTSIAPAIRIAIQDGFGNTVPTATLPVSLELGTGSTGATLQGTTTVAPVAGIATFSAVQVDRASATTRLRAVAAGVTPTLSAVFQVVAP